MSKTKFTHDFSGDICLKCHYKVEGYPYKVTQPCTMADKPAETLEELLKRYWDLMPPADRDFFKNHNAFNNRMRHPEPYRFQAIWLLDELQEFIDNKLAEAEKKRDKECKESNHLVLRGDAAVRMYEVLHEGKKK